MIFGMNGGTALSMLWSTLLLELERRARPLMPEWLRRRLCRRYGHDEVEARHGAPVVEFECCRRCGKIGARLGPAGREETCAVCGHTKGRHLQSCPNAPWR